MNRYVVYLSIFVGTILLAASHSEARTNTGSTSAEVAPPPRPAFMYRIFEGKVIEVGKDSITVQGFSIMISGNATCERIDQNAQRKGIRTLKCGPKPGEPFLIYSGPLGLKHDIKGEVLPGTFRGPGSGGCDIPAIAMVQTRESVTITHPDGKVSVLRREDEPPRTFKMEWPYTIGGFPDSVVWPEVTYRLADIQVGDEVYLRFRRDDNLCYIIQIVRRPGGKIPPAVCVVPNPEIVAALRNYEQYHERMQVCQDYEEKGTPIPWKFLTSDERAERTAPPPREVIRPAKK